MAESRGGRNRATIGSLFLASTGLLLFVIDSLPTHYLAEEESHSYLLQELPSNVGGLSKAQTDILYQAPWLQDIFGKETTYDFDYIKSLKAGSVEDAGYKGLPQIKGVLPTDNEMASADALLKRAIDTKTMPSDIENVWDGKPYVPDDKLKEEITNAWSGLHMAMGEKKWEKMVEKDCAGKTPSECDAVMSGKHEGYKTAWDGTEWKQFDGESWKTLTYPQD